MHWSAARQKNAAFYDAAFARAGLGDAGRTPPRRPAARGTSITSTASACVRRDELRTHLGAQGVGAEIYYPLPLHMQQCFAYLGHKPEDFPESLRASRETLALPIYPELTEDATAIRRRFHQGFLQALTPRFAGPAPKRTSGPKPRHFPRKFSGLWIPSRACFGTDSVSQWPTTN